MDTFTLCLVGDVMTGRGIDQIQMHPCAPGLYERWIHDARDYVRLAERLHGRVPSPVTPAYIWGDALAEIDKRAPARRLVNLETAVTTSSKAWPGKGIHYRMHPANIACLTAARIDCCTLANNHVLDWGEAGLQDTLQTLRRAGIATCGAGPDATAAGTPATLPLAGNTRLLVFSWATSDSGVPLTWGATAQRPGVALLPDLSEASARQVAQAVANKRRPGDRVVVSLHWGGNWGAQVPVTQRRFAQRLVEMDAADLIHGHSSHHPRPIEVYRNRLILYGCGDLINDYEGIGSHEALDPSAVCLYFASLAQDSGALIQLEMVPLQLRRLRLTHACAQTRSSLQALINASGSMFHTGVQQQVDGSWKLHWQ